MLLKTKTNYEEIYHVKCQKAYYLEPVFV